MKDFDAERALRSQGDRTFQLGGHVFTRKASVRPEVLFEYEDMPRNVGAGRAVEIIDTTLKQFLESEEDIAAYDAMRAREEDAVTVNDLSALLKWLIEESTGRPTGRSSLSSAGQDQTRDGTQSTDDSPSPVTEEAGSQT